MNNKKKAIVIAIVAGLGVVGGGYYLTKNGSNELKNISFENSSSTYNDIRSEFKEKNYRMVDGNTNLSQIVNKNVNEIKTWNNKGLKPSFFSTSKGATPDELVISIENEKNDLLKYKAIFDKIDCEKTESKFDCNKIKNNLNKVEAEYNDYKVNILKFK